jgi:hypothetical protein
MAIDAMAQTIEEYPKSGFLENVEIICDVMPKAGKIII